MKILSSYIKNLVTVFKAVKENVNIVRKKMEGVKKTHVEAIQMKTVTLR